MRTFMHVVFMIALVGVITFAPVLAANLTSTDAAAYALQSPATFSGQSATLLPDGSWLLLGGEVNGKATGVAIIENSITGKRTTLSATLSVARAWHTATLLPNGLVFIFGGIGDTGKLVNQAEYFDPTAKSFSLAPPTGLTPRSHHTANVLTDGSVLFAGGAEFATAQLWDSRTNEVTEVSNDMVVPRVDALSTLLATSPVLIWGGTDITGLPISGAEFFLPSQDAFAPAQVDSALLPPNPDATLLPSVSATMPVDGAENISVSALLSARFNERMNVTTLNGSTVTLIGPSGQVSARVVPAEQGMLLFVTPAQELLPDSNYTLFIRGASDGLGKPLSMFTLGFKTASLSAGASSGVVTSTSGSGTISVVESSLPPSVGVWQPSSGAYGGNWFMGPVTKTAQANVPMLMASQGITALSGQVLLQNGAPLPGVAVSVGDQQTVTDSAGRFLVQNIPAGHVQFIVNGRTVNTAAIQFGQFVIGADIQSYITNILSYTVWMPVIDTAHAFNIPSPTTQEVDVTSPLMPGVVLKIPAGVVIREPNGNIVTQISLTPVPLDRAPFPLPPAHSLYFVVQPGGAILESVQGDQRLGAQLVYPNTYKGAPGAASPFWYYDPSGPGWMIYGHGHVSKAGDRIDPDSDVQIYSFTAFMDGESFYPPAPTNQPINGCQCGDPVDTYTGLFIYSHVDLVLPGTIPIVIRRSYQSSDTYPREFGVGFSHNYGMYLYTPTGPRDVNFPTLSLALPDGSVVQYTRTGSSPPTGLVGLLMAATNTPSEFYGSTITYNPGGGAEGYLVLALKDGTIYNFNTGDGRWLRQIVNHNGQTLQIFPADPGDISGENYPAVEVYSPNGINEVGIQYVSSNPGAYPQGTSMIASITDNSGRSVNYAYDSSNRLIKVTYPDGGVEQYTYNGSTDEIASIILPNGQTQVTNTYDSNGRVTKQILADGGTYQFAYVTSGGQVTQTTITDPNNNVRVLNFNSAGYVISETYASGTSISQTSTYIRDPSSNLITSVTDALGRTTNLSYDSMGNLQSTTLLAGTSNAVTYGYTYTPNFNEIATATDPLNNTTTFGYDGNGNLTTVTNALGVQIATITPNSLGLPATITDALGHTTTLNYTGSDLTSITDPLGRTSTRNVDAIGRVLSTVDPLGASTSYTYDPMNRVTSITDALGAVTSMSYDLDGNLLSVTDARGDITSYKYDYKDRPTSRTDPLGQTDYYQYDYDNNLTQQTDRKDQIHLLSYDALNRMTGVAYKTSSGSIESTVTYGYDAGNRVTGITDSVGGTLTEGYDGLDRLTSETSPNGSVSYQYDAASRRTQMTVAGQTLVKYGYDNANRLTGITQSSSSIGIAYDNANRRTMLTLPNGIQLAYGYDNANELTGLTYTLSGNPVGNMTYAYDNDGRIVNRGGTFDVTNLPATVASAVYDADNRLTTWGSATLSYDADGNLTGDGTNTYTWNTRNQLMGISGGSTGSFVYDALGRRESKTIAGTSTNFLYDGLNLEQELSGTTPTVNYLTGAGIDEVFSRTDSSGSYSYLTDNLGSSLALTNSSGVISTSYSYESYGNTTAAGTSSTNTLQYTGRENDGDGLYYNRARYYSPVYGRFISEDPLSFNGGDQNLYEFVFSDPINLIDPLGLWGVKAGIFDGIGGYVQFGINPDGSFYISGGVGFGAGIYADLNPGNAPGWECGRKGVYTALVKDYNYQFHLLNLGYGVGTQQVKHLDTGVIDPEHPYREPFFTPGLELRAGAAVSITGGFSIIFGGH